MDAPGGPAGMWQAPAPAAPPPPFGSPQPAQPFDAPQPPPTGAQPTRTPQPDPQPVDQPVAEPAEPRSGLPVGVIVGVVLVGATVLVLGALSIPYLLGRLNPPPAQVTYTVGDCVAQDGSAARPVECTEPGAFEIVSQVENRDDCEDPTQPAVEVAGPPVRFYCLTPVSTASPES
jgi:hypothetical protein